MGRILVFIVIILKEKQYNIYLKYDYCIRYSYSKHRLKMTQFECILASRLIEHWRFQSPPTWAPWAFSVHRPHLESSSHNLLSLPPYHQPFTRNPAPSNPTIWKGEACWHSLQSRLAHVYRRYVDICPACLGISQRQDPNSRSLKDDNEQPRDYATSRDPCENRLDRWGSLNQSIENLNGDRVLPRREDTWWRSGSEIFELWKSEIRKSNTWKSNIIIKILSLMNEWYI